MFLVSMFLVLVVVMMSVVESNRRMIGETARRYGESLPEIKLSTRSLKTMASSQKEQCSTLSIVGKDTAFYTRIETEFTVQSLIYHLSKLIY